MPSNPRKKAKNTKIEDESLYLKYLFELDQLELSNKSLESLLKKILKGSRTDLRKLAETIARNQAKAERNNGSLLKTNKNREGHKEGGNESTVPFIENVNQIDWSKINYELCKFLYETGGKIPNPEFITRITAHAIQNLEIFKQSLLSFIQINLIHNLHKVHSQSIKSLNIV
ncbi:MAG: hypothetical protein ACTSRS_20080 [Candidatus Helarchaeota archaeon]